MKTTIKRRKWLHLLALTTLLFVLPSFSKAQCPVIQNNLGCQISVRVDVYQPDPMGVCSVICNSYVAGLGVFSTVPINCGPCPAPCNIVVTVLTVNGVPVPPGISADFTTVPPGVSVPAPVGSPCKPQPGSPNPRLYYVPGMFRFVP